MDVLKRLELVGLIPVIVLEDENDAVPLAKALKQGGINVMEITMRTAAGLKAIARIADECPDMLLGAGTVLSVDQAEKCVKAGAKFIVSPGFDENVVKWCIDKNVCVTPGCVTPTEIMRALALGLKVVKFFPANVYGGVSAMKALSAPFDGLKFIPTGGVNMSNLSEFISLPFVHAVGGSWICTKGDISSGNFDNITKLCKEAIVAMHAFEVK